MDVILTTSHISFICEHFTWYSSYCGQAAKLYLLTFILAYFCQLGAKLGIVARGCASKKAPSKLLIRTLLWKIVSGEFPKYNAIGIIIPNIVPRPLLPNSDNIYRHLIQLDSERLNPLIKTHNSHSCLRQALSDTIFRNRLESFINWIIPHFSTLHLTGT